MSSHKYEDAFRLMWYACLCGHQERVWNSRDGVTPVGIICSSCGSLARRVKMTEEAYDPHHQLNHGQKFFRDGTEDEARKIMQHRFDEAEKNLPATKLMQVRIEKAEAIEQAIHDPELWPEGWPVVDVYGKLTEY